MCCAKDHATASSESACLPHQGGCLSSLLLPREPFDESMIRAYRKFKARCSWRAMMSIVLRVQLLPTISSVSIAERRVELKFKKDYIYFKTKKVQDDSREDSCVL